MTKLLAFYSRGPSSAHLPTYAYRKKALRVKYELEEIIFDIEPDNEPK